MSGFSIEGSEAPISIKPDSNTYFVLRAYVFKLAGGVVRIIQAALTQASKAIEVE